MGGVERYVEDLGAAQAAAGTEVRVLTLDRDLVAGTPGRLPRDVSHRGIEVRRVPGVGNQRKQFPIGGFAEIARTYRWADVVHHHDPRFLFETSLAMRLLTGTPLIFHTHGLIMHTAAFAGAKRLLMRRYYGPAFARFVDMVVADSVGDQDILRDTSGRVLPNLRLIRNAVDLSGFLGVGDATEANTILTWGRIDRHKGLSRLLDVVALLPEDVRLTVAGSGPAHLIAELEDHARRLGMAGRVTWAGRAGPDDLKDLLARAAVVVFPSEFEGFGIALVEAMAAGRVVVASDIPTHREILGRAQSQWLTGFAPATEGAARVSTALALSPAARRKISASLRRRAAKFDLPRLVDEIGQLYSELDVRPT